MRYQDGIDIVLATSFLQVFWMLSCLSSAFWPSLHLILRLITFSELLQFMLQCIYAATLQLMSLEDQMKRTYFLLP